MIRGFRASGRRRARRLGNVEERIRNMRAREVSVNDPKFTGRWGRDR